MSTNRQICFVIEPFGKKYSPAHGVEIDFDTVYYGAVRPAVEDVGLVCIRSDEERGGGIIHSEMLARLLLSEFVIADLTAPNPNVFYELGVRHAAKANTTLCIFSPPTQLPFDVAPLRALTYALSGSELRDKSAEALRSQLRRRLQESLAQGASVDSPLFQLLEGFRGASVDSKVAGVLRDRAAEHEEFDRIVYRACHGVPASNAREELKRIQATLGDLHTADPHVLVKLALAYRETAGWEELLSLVAHLPAETRKDLRIRRVTAMAKCRRRQGDDFDRLEGVRELNGLLSQFGDDPETYGTLGKVQYEMFKANSEGQDDIRSLAAEGHLDQAIDAFRKAFRLNPLDFYVGIRLVETLKLKRNSEATSESEAVASALLFMAMSKGYAYKVDPFEVSVVMQLAILKGDKQLAIETFGKLVSLGLGWEIDVILDTVQISMRANERSDWHDFHQLLEKYISARKQQRLR